MLLNEGLPGEFSYCASSTSRQRERIDRQSRRASVTQAEREVETKGQHGVGFEGWLMGSKA